MSTDKEKLNADIPLESLIGEHLLTGVDYNNSEVRQKDEFEFAECMRFTLDGKTYIATEDPNDGYRSSLDSLALSEKPTIQPGWSVKVVGRMRRPQEGTKCTVLEFVLPGTDTVILATGTEDEDDYYPWFCCEFFPESAGLPPMKDIDRP